MPSLGFALFEATTLAFVMKSPYSALDHTISTLPPLASCTCSVRISVPFEATALLCKGYLLLHSSVGDYYQASQRGRSV